MNNPFFSIILPTYNRKDKTIKAVKSVFNQSFTNFELIVIDDFSVDNTYDELAKFDDQRLILLRNNKNMERCFSRNEGIKISKGKYILLLDSDDYFLENHLESWYNYIESEEFPDALMFSDKKLDKNNSLSIIHCKEINTNFTEYFFLNSVIPGQVCMSSSIAKKFEFIQKTVPFEDAELWMRISLSEKILYNDKTSSYVYLEHDDNSVNEKKYNVYFARIRVIKDILSSKKYNKFLAKNSIVSLLDSSYLGVYRFHSFNSSKLIQFKWILISILRFPKKNLKHKILLLLSLLPFIQNVNFVKQRI
jgi:glycosyltransferase involved in cell wall biosynthesis